MNASDHDVGVTTAVTVLTMASEPSDRLDIAGVLLELEPLQMVATVAALTTITNWALDLHAAVRPGFDRLEIIRRFGRLLQEVQVAQEISDALTGAIDHLPPGEQEESGQ